MGICKCQGYWSKRVIGRTKDGEATKGVKSGICVGNFEGCTAHAELAIVLQKYGSI